MSLDTLMEDIRDRIASFEEEQHQQSHSDGYDEGYATGESSVTLDIFEPDDVFQEFYADDVEDVAAWLVESIFQRLVKSGTLDIEKMQLFLEAELQEWLEEPRSYQKAIPVGCKPQGYIFPDEFCVRRKEAGDA